MRIDIDFCTRHSTQHTESTQCVRVQKSSVCCGDCYGACCCNVYNEVFPIDLYGEKVVKKLKYCWNPPENAPLTIYVGSELLEEKRSVRVRVSTCANGVCRLAELESCYLYMSSVKRVMKVSRYKRRWIISCAWCGKLVLLALRYDSGDLISSTREQNEFLSCESAADGGLFAD